MRYAKMAYIVIVLLVGIVGFYVSMLYPDNELVILSLAHIVLAVLTFPLGVIAAILAALLVLAGIATPAEALIVATPFYAALGYAQWWRILPAVYRNRPSLPNSPRIS